VCGLVHNYQHLEDLVAFMSVVFEKDFDTVNICFEDRGSRLLQNAALYFRRLEYSVLNPLAPEVSFKF
jgi:hypothetical protein